MASTIDTRFIDVVTWAAQSTTLLLPYGTIPRLIDPDGWRVWARCVVALPAIAALTAPQPDRYERWDEWARQFNMVAKLLTT